MALDMEKLLNQLKVLIIVGIIVLIAQNIGYDVPIIDAVPGMIIVIAIAFFALIVKGLLPKLKFPAFAWASLTALILSMPFMPTSEIFLRLTDEVIFLGTTAPILAFAGISVGNKIEALKKLSWRVFVVAIFVFLGTFFGSAIVSQIVLSLQGII